ncbi:hypothetical protein MNBD_PLANCTO02-684 [hydrothermal vent metagenome]|uniref:RNA polymerase sigma-70 region 2 domain-containing protein n=1 Tax=hydrothermal vent metagenome TaxID=652676 RepID=A0A3B1DU99_9ZZZZ
MSKYSITEELIDELTKNQGRLYAYILSLVGNVEDARDIQQEVNRTILQKADDYKKGTSFVSWARQISTFKVRSYWRDKGREKVIFSDELISKMSQPIEDATEGYDDQLIALKQCVNKLPPDKQQMLKQRYQESMPLDDLAAYWNRSYKATVTMLSRVRVRLLDCIQKSISAGG